MLKQPRVSLIKAVAIIFISLILCSGSALLGVLYLQKFRQARLHDPRYHIAALIHSCRGGPAVQTCFLAQLLDLSIDTPSNLYAFDAAVGQAKLLQCGVIEDAVIKKMPPQTLFIQYTLRQPVAYVADYENGAIAADGVLMPFNPFYTPKNIPEFRLSKEDTTRVQWGQQLTDPKVKLAFSILRAVNKHFPFALFTLERIDVSNAFNAMWGQREVVLTVKERVELIVDGRPTLLTALRILRLTAEDFTQQLANYLLLRDTLNKELLAVKPQKRYWTAPTVIIDMRISQQCIISLPL